jgi:hypothetical protein
MINDPPLPGRQPRSAQPKRKSGSRTTENSVLLQCIPGDTSHEGRLRVQSIYTHIFSAAHEPKYRFTARTKTVGRKRFPTPKYRALGTITYRNQSMENGLFLFDVDPDVVAMSPYPLTIRYTGTDREQRAIWKDHVPDIALLRRDGSVEFLDFEHDKDVEAYSARTEELELSLQDCGASYRLMKATEILAQPRFYNANVIWLHKPLRGESIAYGPLEREILRQTLPMSIANLSKVLKLNALVTRDEGQPRDAATLVPEVNVVFTACMQLAYVGKVSLDMSKPVSTDTVVTRRI